MDLRYLDPGHKSCGAPGDGLGGRGPVATTQTNGYLCENEVIPPLASTSTSSTPIDRVLHRFEGLHINKKRSTTSVHLEDGCSSVRHDEGNSSRVPKQPRTSTIIYGE